MSGEARDAISRVISDLLEEFGEVHSWQHEEFCVQLIEMLFGPATRWAVDTERLELQVAELEAEVRDLMGTFDF